MEYVLQGKQITKTFGGGEEATRALDAVDVNIGNGEFVAVMGPSGSGKSTLLFALSSTDSIDGGSVELEGENLSQCGENVLADLRRQKMGFVFQYPTMLKNLDLLDNIILPSMQEKEKGKAEILDRAKRLMADTGIGGLEKREITEVSGGQLQRAGICRALMAGPKILFADEPTGALNSKAAEEIMELLSEVHGRGTAILLVTHDAKVASYADRVLFMMDGRVKSELVFDPSVKDREKRGEQVRSEMSKMDI